jgi:hypothetical protein
MASDFIRSSTTPDEDGAGKGDLATAGLAHQCEALARTET